MDISFYAADNDNGSMAEETAHQHQLEQQRGQEPQEPHGLIGVSHRPSSGSHAPHRPRESRPGVSRSASASASGPYRLAGEISEAEQFSTELNPYAAARVKVRCALMNGCVG